MSNEHAPKKAILRRRMPRPKLLLMILPILCLITCLLVEYTPRFIVIPIQPPSEKDGTKDWWTLTYSIDVSPDIGRSYIWRREGWVFEEGESWNTLKEYFDQQLFNYGWQQSGYVSECYAYLPEAGFLEHGANGFIGYRRQNYEPTDESRDEDLICLAIWKKGNSESSYYNIVLASITPSFLLKVISGLD